MFRTIVVGVNATETARRAADQAAELAEALDAELHLVCAFAGEATAPLSGMVAGPALVGRNVGPPPTAGETRVRAERFLASLARATSSPAHVHALPGDPAEAILQVCGEVDADLVVVGNRGMQGARRVLGSVPNTISHRAPCSVLIVHTV